MDQLPERLRARAQANADRETRVIVWTVAGTQIGIAGVGEEDDRLTFPRRLLAGNTLNTECWHRFASPDEMRQDGKWYRIYEHPVRALCYANGEIAGADEPMGLHIQDGVQRRRDQAACRCPRRTACRRVRGEHATHATHAGVRGHPHRQVCQIASSSTELGYLTTA